MVTPEELAEAACNDQAWKQIQSRAATECRATCFRAAIKILNRQISRLSPNSLESAREQIEKRLGRDRLGRLAPLLPLTTFIGYDELGGTRQRMRDYSHIIVHSGNDLPAFTPGSR